MDVLAFAILIALIGVLLWYVWAIRSKLDALSQKSSAVLDTAQFESLLELEIQRARRLNYPVSLVNLQVGIGSGRSSGSDSPRGLVAENSLNEISWELSPAVVNVFRDAPDSGVTIRATDSAIFDRQKNRLALMLVGTSREDAETVAERVAGCLQQSMQFSVRYGCAEFPADCYLAEDLIAGTEVPDARDAEPAEVRPSRTKEAAAVMYRGQPVAR